MYISGGENVYPAEVEDVLYQLSAIAEVAIIGVADERWGEVGRAIIALKPDHVLTEAEIYPALRSEPGALQAPALDPVCRSTAAKCDGRCTSQRCVNNSAPRKAYMPIPSAITAQAGSQGERMVGVTLGPRFAGITSESPNARHSTALR